MDNEFKVGKKSDDGGERVSSRRRGPRPSLLRSVGAELAGCLQLAKCLSGWCRWCRWCPQQPPVAPSSPLLPSGARRKAAKRARARGEFENTKNTRSLVVQCSAVQRSAAQRSLVKQALRRYVQKCKKNGSGTRNTTPPTQPGSS